MRHPPSQQIHQTNPFGVETACIAQILYMNDDLELFGLEAFNKFVIGWQPDRGDTEAKNLFYMLKTGYRVHEITPHDPQQLALANGQEYLEGIWRQNGESSEAIKRELPKVFPLAQRRALFKQRAISMYPRNYSCEPRFATLKDITKLLRDGWQVMTYIEKTDEIRQVVMTRLLEDNRYEIFDPMADQCVAIHHANELRLPATLTLQAYRKLF